MPVIRSADAIAFETHGSRFESFVRPSTGSTQLCAWRLVVPPGLRGVAHRPSREEVVLVLSGHLHVTIDGITSALESGHVAHVPAGSELCIDTGSDGGSAWVTTTPGLTATTADGATISPPWAR